MELTWVKTVNIGTGERVATQGLLRSDGKWWMWEVSDHAEYLRDTKQYLEGKALSQEDEFLNGGGEEEFDRFFEQERGRRGLVYMNQVDVFQTLEKNYDKEIYMPHRSWDTLFCLVPVNERSLDTDDFRFTLIYKGKKYISDSGTGVPATEEQKAESIKILHALFPSRPHYIEERIAT